jgi:aminoglycoside phosphotransferase (APT) family kinase protein
VCRKGETPPQKALRWTADVIGSQIESMEPLRADHSPWRLRFHRRDSDVVLRIMQPGWINAEPIRTNAAALQIAEQHGLAAPRLIAVDPDGDQAGTPATLETVLPGSSAIPPHASPDRLRAFGVAIARVHAIPLQPQDHLPLLTRSKQMDRPMERRWATLYKASADHAKPNVIEALRELTGWPTARARETMDARPGTALLQLADERLRTTPRPEHHSVFLHGDIHGGNSLWDGDTCLALIDWKDAGVGDPGIDLALLRLHMTMQYGMAAPPYVLEGWEREAGRPATAVAYWDAIAALNTTTVLHNDPGFDDNGTPLDAMAVTARRDAFLRDAITALP